MLLDVHIGVDLRAREGCVWALDIHKGVYLSARGGCVWALRYTCRCVPKS